MVTNLMRYPVEPKIIDELRSRDIVVGASEKQMALILRLIEELGADRCRETRRCTNLEELSGGRNGSASKQLACY